ncbi:coilin-like isoform X1 [Populus alba x Populus x berolinensis]|uniref:Coilin-like isoform X1 n=1 Tax=Populus alba x Populus x berolinensis TaxID=444605 RepID=A0AAD6Q8W6_9ROSI|nr:coilin-like isoform X1 [Populus alba x Populus x berolinensis]
METVRLRLVLDNALTTTTEGLRKCWILLKPQHRTISDLSSHILHVFDLHNACHSGLLLSMEGFVLPPFESTCILKDKDIVRVIKKGGTATEIIKIDDGLNDSLNVVEIIDKPPVTIGTNLLANEEFEKESDSYESEQEVDVAAEVEDVENSPEVKAVSKKRKASKDAHSPKRKKTKSASAKKWLEVSENVVTDVSAEQNGTLSIVDVDERSGKGRKAMRDTKKRKKTKSASAEKCMEVSENVVTSVCAGQNGTLSIFKADERSSKSTKATFNAQKSCQREQNGNGSVDASHILSGSKKCPSRSARRKKAKRQWLKEQLKAEKKAQNKRELLLNINQQSSEKDNENDSGESPEPGSQKTSEEKFREDKQLGERDSDVEGDVVPIVIRPGHIRFEPLKKGDSDHAVPQNHISIERFQWNGITSKKKGQKWGKEKVVSFKRNDYNNFKKESYSSLTIEERTPVYDCTNFEEFPHYASLPKEGDVIAYRLVELSPSWTPELSSYRVGKVSKYDLESNIVMLVQVPEYPVIPEKIDDEASDALPETSPYQEDGSLEIKFSALFEVRLVHHGNLKSAKSVTGGSNEVHVRDQDSGTGFKLNNNHEAGTSAQENGKHNPWEETKQALTAQKAWLSQEDSCKKPESSGRSPWSYKALRGSALGPTVALLRAQNEL